MKIRFGVRDTVGATLKAANVVAGVFYDEDNKVPTFSAFNSINELRTRALQRTGGGRIWWRQLARSSAGTLSSGNDRRGGQFGPNFKKTFKATPLTGDNPYGQLSSGVGASIDPYGVTEQTIGAALPTYQNYITVFSLALPQDGFASQSAGSLPVPYTYCDVTMWYDIEFYGPVFDNSSS